MGVSQIIVEGVPALPLVINHPAGHGVPACLILVKGGTVLARSTFNFD